MEDELRGNILPFWMAHVVDKANGGFYGAVTNDLQIHNEVPRSSTLCARILWTYATAYRRLSGEEYLSMARRAYDYLTQVFWDQEYGGLYWEVDFQGKPTSNRKHHYAQAFGIYGLSEYYRATQDPRSLTLARTLFRLLEEHAFDPVNGGYIEGCSRRWERLADVRLSDKDLDCDKSMNTMLHLLEAYTNLRRVWDDAHLDAQHRALLEIFLLHVVDPEAGHFKLFFDRRWNSLLERTSFGHDIEGSWLLWEAAEAVADPALLDRVRQASLSLALGVYRDGLDGDGSLFYEGGPLGLVDDGKPGGHRRKGWSASLQCLPALGPGEVRPSLPIAAGNTSWTRWWTAPTAIGSGSCSGTARPTMTGTRPAPGTAPTITAGRVSRCWIAWLDNLGRREAGGSLRLHPGLREMTVGRLSHGDRTYKCPLLYRGPAVSGWKFARSPLSKILLTGV